MTGQVPGQAEAVADGERCHVALLFSDVCDYTALNEGADPEDADLLRKRIEELAERVIRKHHGSISQFYGDGILAVFGLPVPGEDDARSAIEAALEFHETIRAALWEMALPERFEVRVHSGVHSGLVFARKGDALHGRYKLTGDAVNTAARLCGAAQRDEILVSGAALRGIEAFFAAESALDLALKGKRLRVSAYRVTSRSDVRTRFEASSRRGLTAFVDRVSELEQLMQLLGESLDGRGRLVLVTGAAGIGKTRLLEEFALRVSNAGVRVLRGCCDSYSAIAPLEPFLQILRQLFAIESNAPSEATAQLVHGQLRALGASDEQIRTVLRLLSVTGSLPVGSTLDKSSLAVVPTMSALLETVIARGPLLLLLDDWQWADDASRNLLAHLCQSSKQHKLCIVVGVRGQEALDPSLHPDYSISLQPFGAQDSSRVVQALRPSGFDLQLTFALHQRSGGNPLFLEELCRSLPADALGDEGMLAQSGVPNTVQGVIQSRLARLASEPAELLRVASVIGIEFSCTLLAQILGREDLSDTLSALSREDWIYARETGESFRFKHGITREVVYESVRIAQRRKVHREVAQAIERNVNENAGDQSEALAYHYRGGEEHEQAARYAELAGDKAMATSSLDRARFHYAASLAELDRLPQTEQIKRRWLKTSAKWALPCVYNPSPDQLELLKRAMALAMELGDEAAQAQTAHWQGYIQYVLGNYAQTIACYERAVELAQHAGDERLLAQLWSNLGQSHAAAGEYDKALDHLGRGLALKRSRHQPHVSRTVAQGYAYTLGCKALVHGDIGDFEAAELDLREALEAVSGTGHAVEGSVLGLQCIVQIWRGQWQASAETAARNRKTAERVSSAYSFAMSCAFEAYTRFVLERAPTELARMRQVVDWLDGQSIGLFISFNYGCLAEALLSSGESDLAQRYALRALVRAELKDPLGETAAYRVLARIHAAKDHPASARVDDFVQRAFASAAARGSKRDAAVTRLLVAELAASSGGAAENVRAPAEQALREFERMGMIWHAEAAKKLL
jgi:class 3 adenylate cyclase/tetratricopeptide (TPR) repeat protein